MGSACHQLGVYELLPMLQGLLRDHGLDRVVELRGNFCLECCAEGIAIRFRERLFVRITPLNLRERFAAELLPALTARTVGGGDESR